jgi:hypothetical protein
VRTLGGLRPAKRQAPSRITVAAFGDEREHDRRPVAMLAKAEQQGVLADDEEGEGRHGERDASRRQHADEEAPAAEPAVDEPFEREDQ